LKKLSFFEARKSCPCPFHGTCQSFRAGLGLGRAARVFYNVKQLKTAFQTGLGPKKIFAGFKISTHARPVRFVDGPGTGRAGLEMLKYTHETLYLL
jgi:hypothetical protein